MTDSPLFHKKLASYVLLNFLSRQMPAEQHADSHNKINTAVSQQDVQMLLEKHIIKSDELAVYLADMLSDETIAGRLGEMGFYVQSRQFDQNLRSLLDGILAPTTKFATVLADALQIKHEERNDLLRAAHEAELLASNEGGTPYSQGVIRPVASFPLSDNIAARTTASRVDVLNRAENLHRSKGIAGDYYWRDCIPDSSRTYVPLGELLHAQGLGNIKPVMDQFRDIIAQFLMASDKGPITLDDGHKTSADKAFFFAASHSNDIGRKTFYCDSQSGEFLLSQAGIYPTLPKEKIAAKWVTASVMNNRLGRPHYGYSAQEVHDFLLETRKKKEIDVGDTKRNPAGMIGIYRSPSNERVSEGGMGYSVYCDPAIEPYLRENLICNLIPDKKHWFNLAEALKELQVNQGFANRYALTEILKGLHKADQKVTYRNSEQKTVTRRARQCLGPFGINNLSGNWMVDPDVLGQVIIADEVRAKKAEILADDTQRAAMDAQQEANRRGSNTMDAVQSDAPKRPFGKMLEEYVAGGGTDFIALLEQYQAENCLSHSQMEKVLGINDATWRQWRQRAVTTFVPATISDISSRFDLTPAQDWLLRQLAGGKENALSPLATLIADTKAQLEAVGWQERDKRAQIAGAFFTRLTESYATQWLAKDTEVTVNTIRAWRTEIKPERDVLKKMDVVAKNPKLVPDAKLSQTVADLLLGLPERKTPLALLELFEADKLTLGEVLLQKRLEKREKTEDCGAKLSTKGEGGATPSLVSNLERNHSNHVTLPTARLMADYIGFGTDTPDVRYRFLRRAAGLRPVHNPDEMMKQFIARDAELTDSGDKNMLVREYIVKFIDNLQVNKIPLFLEMLNSQLPAERHVTKGGMLYWTDIRPGRQSAYGIYSDIMEEVMDIIGLKDEVNRRTFAERFSVDRLSPATGSSKDGAWAIGHMEEKAGRNLIKR